MCRSFFTKMADLIKNILLVGLGSFVGGGARYLITVAMKNMGGAFPVGTLAVNLFGCLLIGLFTGYINKSVGPESGVALFLTYGICGGFTTFSTFSRETLVMLQSGNYCGALCYVALSVVLGIILTACGYMLVQ